MGDSECEFSEKIDNVKSKSSKKAEEATNYFSKMLKLKAESLEKTEEMLASGMHDLEKLKQDVAKSKDLALESKPRLNIDITVTRAQMRQKYDELKTRISAAIVPK